MPRTTPSSHAVLTGLNITLKHLTHEKEETVITTQIHGDVGLIKVDGRLTFQEYGRFKNAANEVLDGRPITEIALDLSGATHMDSNALGMLIALKNRAESRFISIKLLKPSPGIQAILELVQFEKLFQIVS